MTDLLSCPFCGGDAGPVAGGPKYYFVNCTECLAATNTFVPEAGPMTESEAIAAWNTRAPTPAEAIARAALERAAEVAGNAFVASDMGGDLICEPYQSEMTARAIRAIAADPAALAEILKGAGE